MSKFKMITLCGSVKFKDEFKKIQGELTLKGYIVLSRVFSDFKSNETLDLDTVKMLSSMHYEKIKMSKEIFVINKDDYIDEDTLKHINFAKKYNKIISYLNPIKTNESSLSEEITDAQKYAIDIIERYYDIYDAYDGNFKFEGKTKEEAREFISKYYDEAKREMRWQQDVTHALVDPWGNS